MWLIDRDNQLTKLPVAKSGSQVWAPGDALRKGDLGDCPMRSLFDRRPDAPTVPAAELAGSMRSLFDRRPDKARPDVFVLRRSVDRAGHYRKTALHSWRKPLLTGEDYVAH